MPLTKELIQQLREHMKMFTDVGSISVTFKTEDAKALLETAEECARLQAEVETLKQTSVAVERPDGSVGYIQVHCTYPHDHLIDPGTRIKIL